MIFKINLFVKLQAKGYGKDEKMSEIKVLLIEPLVVKFFLEGDLPDNKLGLYALEKLAGYLEAHGISTEVIGMRDKTIDQIVDVAVRLNPLIIGFSVLTLNFWLVKKLAERIKKRLPEVVIVLGGYHISTVPVDITKSEAFDYGVLGYGEIPLGKLAERLIGGCEDLDDIPGLVIRDPEASDGYRKTAMQILPEVENFSWAKRNWSAVHKARCTGLFFPAPEDQEGGVAQVSTEYGCNGQCTFCGTAAMIKNSYTGGCRVSCREVRDIIEELKMLKSRGVRVIFFTTATFNRSPERLREICEAIIAAGLHSPLPEDHLDHIHDSLHFYAYVKVGLTKEQAALLAKAGFTVLAVGIESADAEIVRGFNKPYAGFSKVVEHIKNWDAVGGITRALLIYPTPPDSPETMRALIERLKLALPDCIRIAHLCPSPGTLEGEKLLKEGLVLDENYDLYDHNHLLGKTPGFSPEEAAHTQDDIYRAYYLSLEYQKHVADKIEKFPWLRNAFIAFFAALYRQKKIDLRGLVR